MAQPKCYNSIMKPLVLFILLSFTIVAIGTYIYQQKDSELTQPSLPLTADDTQNIPEMYKVSLQAAEIDTREKDLTLDTLNTTQDILVIIQLKDPTVNTSFYDSFAASMQKFEACRLGYVPNYASLYMVNGGSLKEITMLSEVNWIGRYYPKYKTLLSGSSTENPITVAYSNCGDAETTLAEVAKLGKLNTEPFCSEDNICTITEYTLGEGRTIEELIEIESVIWVEEYMMPKLN